MPIHDIVGLQITMNIAQIILPKTIRLLSQSIAAFVIQWLRYIDMTIFAGLDVVRSCNHESAVLENTDK